MQEVCPTLRIEAFDRLIGTRCPEGMLASFLQGEVFFCRRRALTARVVVFCEIYRDEGVAPTGYDRGSKKRCFDFLCRRCALTPRALVFAELIATRYREGMLASLL